MNATSWQKVVEKAQNSIEEWKMQVQELKMLTPHWNSIYGFSSNDQKVNEKAVNARRCLLTINNNTCPLISTRWKSHMVQTISQKTYP